MERNTATPFGERLESRANADLLIDGDGPVSRPPASGPGITSIRNVDSTHAYSIFDTEIERLFQGPGAVDFIGLSAPLAFHGYLLSPPNSVFTQEAYNQGGYVDAEKIVWRDSVALVALGDVDFAGIVHNHFNRHGVLLETDKFGMVPKDNPEYQTPAGMPYWAMKIYYKFLNCGFKLPVSAGSASGVMPSPLGYDRVYVHLPGEFTYRNWFEALKRGRSFGTNGPMLFLTVDGHEPGDTIVLLSSNTRLKIRAKASSAGNLDHLDIIWKGRVVKTVYAAGSSGDLVAGLDLQPEGTGWIAARVFEKPAEAAHFAHTSPVYVQAGNDPGREPQDVKFFIQWLDRDIAFYKALPDFRSEADRQALLDMFRKARAVYERK